jgi:hypothetical protein
MGAVLETVKKIYIFYRYECCFPYSISFLLVLLIYSLDFYTLEKAKVWPSLISYIILAGYYVYNVSCYRKRILPSHDPKFYMSILSIKVFLWSVFLLALIFFKNNSQL